MANFPGNPSPRQIASADQRIALVREVADRLVQTRPPATGDITNDVVQLAYGPIVDAMLDISAPGDEEAALIALAADLLLRLITREVVSTDG